MRSLVIIFLLSCSGLSAQDNATDILVKIQGAFKDKAVWAKVKIEGYKKEKDTKSFPIGEGEFRIIPGKGYYSSFEGEVYVSDRSRTLMIDKEGKAIGVTEQGMKSMAGNTVANADLIKKAIELADSVGLQKVESSGVGKVIIYSKDQTTPVTEIWYSLKDYKMTRIVYHYNNTPEANHGAEKMVISYTYNDVSGLKEDFFSTSKIVQKKVSGKYEAEGIYKSFTVYKM